MLLDSSTKFVGFWKETDDMGWFPGKITFTSLPVPNSATRDQSSIINKIASVQMKARTTRYMGYSTCRICSARNGSVEFTYNGFTWPEGYIHYLKDHSVAIDTEFKQMILVD